MRSFMSICLMQVFANANNGLGVLLLLNDE